MDAEDQIPPMLPCLPAGRLYKREEFPLFGKEGLGEIFATICLLNYGLLSTPHAAHDTHPTPFQNILTSVSFFDIVLICQEDRGWMPRGAYIVSLFFTFFRYPPGSLPR
jgi:hypothetical protein